MTTWMVSTRQRLIEEGVKLFRISEDLWFCDKDSRQRAPEFHVTVFYPDYDPFRIYDPDKGERPCEFFHGTDSWKVVEDVLRFICNGYKKEVTNG